MNRLTIFLCLCLPSFAFAQPSGWDDPTICFLDGATGSFISIDGDSSFILSCAHGLDGPMCDGQTRDGQRLVCRVVAKDDEGDAAILKFNGRASQPAKIASGPAINGSQLWYCGFPMGQPLQTKTATAKQGLGDLNQAYGSPIPGDSGGPVRNSAGEIVGTVTGYDCTPDGQRLNTMLYSKWKTINRLVGEVRQRGYVETQCGPGGCGSCGPNGCPVYFNAQPAYRIEQRPPQRPAPQPAIAQPSSPVASVGPQGPAGPAGPQGPPGPPGTGSNCECGPKWTEINQSLTQIRADIDASQKAVSELTLIVGDLSKRPAAPSMDEIVAEVEKRRKPARIRIVDPQGKYTTEFKALNDGTDTDLVIEQRYTPAQ